MNASPRLKLLIVGYGKMGRAVEEVVTAAGHDVRGRVDPLAPEASAASVHEALEGDIDAAIEFTTPGEAASNVLALLDADVPVVSGTTGWLDALESARDRARDRSVGFLWAPNFSLGIAVFSRLLESATHWFASAGDFAPWLVEWHHDRKVDGPSGTASRLAQILVDGTPGKSSYGPPPGDRAVDSSLLPVSWVRAGTIPGEHRVGWDAPGESFEMAHRARDRRVFAAGAARAAEWIVGQDGPRTLDDLLAQTVFTSGPDFADGGSKR